MSKSITRRAALSGASAVALTATAPALAADHPDAELLALWGELQDAEAEADRLFEEYQTVYNACLETCPPPPYGLVQRFGHEAWEITRPRIEGFWKTSPVGMSHRSLIGGRCEAFVDLREQHARERDRSLAEFDEWAANRKAHEASYGVDAACNAYAVATERLAEIEGRIIAAPARTPAGLAVKLRLFAAHDPGMGEREIELRDYHTEIFADVLAQAERLGANHG